MATKEYSISVDFGGGNTTKSTGESMLSALQALKRPVKINGKTFITVRHGKEKAELMYLPVRAKRLFYPNAQLYIAKQLEYLLK